jgi:YHS domain-containing protein
VPFAVPLGPVVDAEWALFHLSRALWDPVDPKQIGSLEDSLQFRVNGEVYRFANERNLRRFMESPALWCGLVRDPVSGRRFLPSKRSPAAYWVGGPYLFENEANKQAFIEDPHKYQIIRRM